MAKYPEHVYSLAWVSATLLTLGLVTLIGSSNVLDPESGYSAGLATQSLGVNSDPCPYDCGVDATCRLECANHASCNDDPNCADVGCPQSCGVDRICTVGCALDERCNPDPDCQKNCNYNCARDNKCNEFCTTETSCSADPDCPSICNLNCAQDGRCNTNCATSSACAPDPDCAKQRPIFSGS